MKVMENFKPLDQSVSLLEALRHEYVRFAHWKGNCHLRDSLEGRSDIELLIDSKHREVFESVLARLNFIKAYNPPWLKYPEIEDWLGFDNATGQLLHLDTHYEILTGMKFAESLRLPWSREILSELIIDDDTNWPILRPEFEAIVLLIRIKARMSPKARWKKNPKIPDRRMYELLELLHKSNAQTIQRICRLLNLNMPKNFVDNIDSIKSTNSKQEILCLSTCIYNQVKKYYTKSRVISLFRSYFYRYYLAISSVYSRFFFPIARKKKLVSGGKIFALIGSDGSGKSTLSRELFNWLLWKIDTYYFYMGNAPFIKSYIGMHIAASDILYQDSKLGRILRRLLQHHIHIFRAKRKLKMLKMAKRLRRGGSIVLCDRFPQKYTLGMNDGPKLQLAAKDRKAHRELRLFEQMTELEPDVIFRLQIPPEIAIARKPNHDIEMLKQKCSSIDRLIFRSAKVIDIDASRPYSEVLLKVKQEIWRHLH